MLFVVIFTEVTEKSALKRGTLHLRAKIAIVHDCVAMSATVELLVNS